MMFNCIIMGAAGRDFHDFQTFFIDHPEFHVCAFTATQIPFIAQRSYPQALAGDAYDADIPIYEEEELPRLIAELKIDFVFFAYSDLPHVEVMHRAAIVQSCGAGFVLLGPLQTTLQSSRKVVAITATRTGAGKSPLTQWLASALTRAGVPVVTMRHPMPYGDLAAQAVQRFAELEDLDHHKCTIEEREEYEPYVRRGLVIYAGVDYRAVLRAAEAEAEIILWDGGNNDFAFIAPDLNIVVSDALRAGHGLDYYPGETNFRAADILVINKVADASPEDIERILALKALLNPGAKLVLSDLEVTVEDPDSMRGKRVLIVEDGPTVTHGGMAYGAGWVAAQKYGVGDIIDPRPFAVGGIREVFARNRHLERVLPAMGYSQHQCRELKATIEASEADLVLNASPANIATLLELALPVTQVNYRFVPRQGPDMLAAVMGLLAD
ncbi:MAG: GTPase [Gammaproteobacteria bacterium]|nr:MAG: GTPase [Gammaproteobacteria bacterium]